MPTDARPSSRERPGPADLNIVVAYATMFGATELVAERVADAFASLGADVTLVDLARSRPADLPHCDLLVIGACTWNVGQLPSDLDAALPELASLDLTGRSLALFGLGDQRGYPDTYLDALGITARAMRQTGARLVGAWEPEGYDFVASEAFDGVLLTGLGLDEDNQHDMTAGRIAAWTAQVVAEVTKEAPGAVFAPGASASLPYGLEGQ